MKGGKKTIHTSATYCWQDEQKQPCICMTAWRKSPPTSLSWLTWINSSTLALSSVLCPESMMQRGWGQFCQSRKNRSTHTYTLSHTHTLVYFFSPSLSILREFFCCSCFSLFDTLFPFFDALFTVGFFIFWYFFPSLSFSLFFSISFFISSPLLSILALYFAIFLRGRERSFQGSSIYCRIFLRDVELRFWTKWIWV